MEWFNHFYSNLNFAYCPLGENKKLNNIIEKVNEAVVNNNGDLEVDSECDLNKINSETPNVVFNAAGKCYDGYQMIQQIYKV